MKDYLHPLKAAPVQSAPAPDQAEADAAFRAAFAKHAELKLRVAEARAAEQEVEQRIATAVRQQDRAKDRLRDEAGSAFAAGAEFDPTKLRGTIQKTELDRIAAEGQLPLARKRREQAERALTDFQFTFDNATTCAAYAREAALLANVRDHLATLAEPFAELAAIAKRREALLGERFSYDPAQCTPCDGRKLAKSFIEALAPRIAPPALTLATINERADELAERLAAELQEAEVSDVL